MQTDFAQALRTLVNMIEFDLAVEAAKNVSRWVGTPGTNPFVTDLDPVSQARKVLDDNGAPGARSLLINSTSAAKARILSNLLKVNESGDTMTLRQGEIGDLFDFSIKQSGQLATFTKGTGASSTTDAAGYAVGSTSIGLASAGTGTIKAGDAIKFAGDNNVYGVITGDTDVSNGGTIKIAEPGLLVAIPTSATAITIQNSYLPNVGFSQNAMRLLERAPSKPEQGDMRIDEYILTDPRSGLSFEVSVWPGQRMVKYEVSAAWGVKNTKSEHTVGIFG
jgi:hypothetical protein